MFFGTRVDKAITWLIECRFRNSTMVSMKVKRRRGLKRLKVWAKKRKKRETLFEFEHREGKNSNSGRNIIKADQLPLTDEPS